MIPVLSSKWEIALDTSNLILAHISSTVYNLVKQQLTCNEMSV